jgi:hypothetical protein
VSYFGRDGLLCNCVGVPKLDEVMCYAYRGDNYGPAGVEETELNFKVGKVEVVSVPPCPACATALRHEWVSLAVGMFVSPLCFTAK